MSEDHTVDFSPEPTDSTTPTTDGGDLTPTQGEQQDVNTTTSKSVASDERSTTTNSRGTSQPFVFEELTLAQALGLFLFRPFRVGRELWRVTLSNRATNGTEPAEPGDSSTWATVDNPNATADINGVYTGHEKNRAALANATDINWLTAIASVLQLRFAELGQLAVLALALLFAFFGASGLREAALDPVMREEGDTGGALFWVGLSALMGVMYLGYRWYLTRREERAQDTPPTADVEQPPLFDDAALEAEPALTTDRPRRSLFRRAFGMVERYAPSLSLVPLAVLMSYLAFSRNVATNPEGDITGVIFTSFGFTMWVGAIALWFIIFTVDFNHLYHRAAKRDWPQWQFPSVNLRVVHLLLLVIVVIGAYFRLHRLDDVPPDMTSDHIEKLIDATRVNNGLYAVFFENNGGREAFQMYTVAAIADWFDVGFNFTALKYATVIEGMLSIILSYWVAKEIIGRQTPERDRLGTWVGLGTAILMALSSWHLMLSRLGLRIVLTPLTVLIVSYFLVRGVRDNRRIDFALMGVVLGLGTYFYQANRMLPILVVVAVVLAIIFNSKARPKVVFRYGFNLAVAGIIAIVAYLPMYRYSEEFPDQFWRRSYGRIFGEQYFSCVTDAGRLDFCRPTITEMVDAMSLKRYGPDSDLTGWQAFAQNYQDALFTYAYEGDGQWITNASGYPALDARTAGLFMLGAVLWLAVMIRFRDIGLVIVPAGIIVLILPSALAIAPGLNENPSYTRLSGTAPFVFMMAALPLAFLTTQAMRIGRPAGAYGAVALGIITLLLINIGERNYDVYFEDYRQGYQRSWKPYSEISAPLREFANSDGSFGNAFYVHHAHWLDHRVLGSVAGDLFWPNGLLEAEDVFSFILRNEGTPYAYNPDQPLLFYLHPAEEDDIEWVQQTFPDGRLREVRIPGDTDFLVYEAPPGLDWMSVTLGAQTTGPGCNLNCLPGPR